MPLLFDPKIKKDDIWYKEGREEGREEALEEKTKSVVEALLDLGKLSIEEIAKTAGTTVEFVFKVQNDLKGK